MHCGRFLIDVHNSAASAYMMVPSMYLSHMVGFSGEVSIAIFSKYFMYIFAITGDKGDSISKHFSCWYNLESSCILFAHRMYFHLEPLCSPREGQILTCFELLIQPLWWDPW